MDRHSANLDPVAKSNSVYGMDQLLEVVLVVLVGILKIYAIRYNIGIPLMIQCLKLF